MRIKSNRLRIFTFPRKLLQKTISFHAFRSFLSFRSLCSSCLTSSLSLSLFISVCLCHLLVLSATRIRLILFVYEKFCVNANWKKRRPVCDAAVEMRMSFELGNKKLRVSQHISQQRKKKNMLAEIKKKFFDFFSCLCLILEFGLGWFVSLNHFNQTFL